MSDDMTPMFGDPIGDWHRVFAWLPIDTVDRGWVWLRFVERRRIQLHSYLRGGLDRWWQYRALRTAWASSTCHSR